MKKRGMRKSQVAMEFLIVMTFAFLMTIPLIILFYKQSEDLNRDITASQIDKIASEIRDTADEVYYLGSPSKKTISVFMPESVESITIGGKKIVFTIDAPGADYELVKWSVANLTGSIQTYSGIHQISVEANENSVAIND